VPIIKAAGSNPVVLMTPLPAYIMEKCCDDMTHITNYRDQDNAKDLSSSMRALCKQLRGLVHYRGWKNVTLFNTAAACGLSARSVPENDTDELEDRVNRVLDLWGTDPVHPTGRAYTMITNKLLELVKEAHGKVSEKQQMALERKKRRLSSDKTADSDDEVSIIGTRNWGENCPESGPPKVLAASRRPWAGPSTGNQNRCEYPLASIRGGEMSGYDGPASFRGHQNRSGWAASPMARKRMEERGQPRHQRGHLWRGGYKRSRGRQGYDD